MNIIHKIIFLLAFSSSVFASGIMNLEGTIYGKTDKTFMILSKNEIFTLSKAKLSDTQKKTIEPMKFGTPITMTVPMDAVIQVKTKK